LSDDDPGGVVLRRDGERVLTATGPVPPGFRRDPVELSWRLGSHEVTFRVVDREEA
jgi:hypothetical protein